MKIALVTFAIIYVTGFALMFLMTTQLPNTFGLALLRSAAWPVSIVRREIWPRGEPLRMD